MPQSNILDQIHDSLPSSVWEHADSPEPTLRATHAHFLKHHIYHVLEQAGYTNPHEWLKLYVTGSLTTWQYSDSSDVDVSLFVDSRHFPEWSRAEMIGIMVGHCDGTRLPGTPYELQAYVVPSGLNPADLFKPGLRAGYSIDQNRWIAPPDHSLTHDVESRENGFYTWAMTQADKLERLLRYEPDKAIDFWHSIHRRRQRDQQAGKGDYSESNIIYKFLVKRGLMPAIEHASGEHIAAWTLPGEVNMTTQPPQNPMSSGPSPFAHTQQWQVNIGNTNNIENHGDHVRQWMMHNHPYTPFQVQNGMGAWYGTPEDSTALHLYATPHHKMRQILESYGQHHPEEEAFAITPSGQESYLWGNPSAG